MSLRPGFPERGGDADRFARFERRLQALESANRLTSASIGSGGLRVKDGGSIRALDVGGNEIVALNVDGLTVFDVGGNEIVILDADGLTVEGTSIDPPPIGSIFAFGGTTAPTGYRLCNGDAISRTTFADLFDVIGTTYGAGDGSTTFNLPDLQQRIPLGKAVSGTGSVLGGTGGAIDHAHTGPSHAHAQADTGAAGGHTHASAGAHNGHGSAGSHDHLFSDTSAGPTTTVALVANGGGANAASVSHTHDVSGTTGSDGSHSHVTSAGGHTHDAIANHQHTNPTTGPAGTGNTGSENPPFQVVNFIVKH